jgi:hypothetical protein
MRKIFNILVLVVAVSVCIHAQYVTKSDTQSDKEWLDSVFMNYLKELEIINDASGYPGGADMCKPACQRPEFLNNNSSYRTVVVDFDPKSGITQCDIYDSNNRRSSFTANTKNLECVKNTTVTLSKSELASLVNATITLQHVGITNQPTGYMKLSRFIASMMTLDPEIINFEDTNSTGILTLNQDLSLLKMVENATDGTISRKVEASVSENLNKANLAYLGF